MRKKIGTLDKSRKEFNRVKNLVGDTDRLQNAIKADDLVVMRRYGNVGRIIDEINDCAVKLRGYVPPSNTQLNLFDITDEDNEIDLRL